MKLVRPWVSKEGRSGDSLVQSVQTVMYLTVHGGTANTSQVWRDTVSPQPSGCLTRLRQQKPRAGIWLPAALCIYLDIKMLSFSMCAMT